MHGDPIPTKKKISFKQVTDVSITPLLKHCKHLQTLIVSGCERISYESLQHIEFCASLVMLAISGISIKHNAVCNLKKLNPHVNITWSAISSKRHEKNSGKSTTTVIIQT